MKDTNKETTQTEKHRNYSRAQYFGAIRGVYKFARMYMNANTNHAYHNWDHAREVAHASLKLAKMEGVGGHERFQLLIASLMHDVYMQPGGRQNEEVSAKLCEMVLPKYKISIPDTIEIADLVRVTDLGVQPKTLLEKVIRDGDTSNMGTEHCLTKGDAVMEELGVPQGRTRYAAQLKFHGMHQWYTQSAKKLWQAGKEGNMKKLEQKIKEIDDGRDLVQYQCF